MKKIFFTVSLVLMLSSMTLAENKLVFVTMITRHGDRTPFINIKNAKYKWKTGLSQLTPKGMNEEYELGKTLRKRYIEDFKLLTPKYIDDSIYTVASDTNRTILSAESLLFGLYPPGSGPKLDNGKPALPNLVQPIPVRSIPEESHLIKVPYPIYIKILNKYIYHSDVWQKKEKTLEAKFKEWTNIFGNKITSLANILGIGDVLIVAQHHNMPLPNGLSKKDAMQIIDLTSWGLATQFKSEKVSYLCGAELLNAMMKNINDAATKKKSYKIVYYSGHDITLLPIMSLLGASLDKASDYTSHLQLELYQNNKTSYNIKLRYNGQTIKLPIMKDNDSCTLKTLIQHVKNLNEKYSKIETLKSY